MKDIIPVVCPVCGGAIDQSEKQKSLSHIPFIAKKPCHTCLEKAKENSWFYLIVFYNDEQAMHSYAMDVSKHPQYKVGQVVTLGDFFDGMTEDKLEELLEHIKVKEVKDE